MPLASGRFAEKAIEPHRVLPRREGEQGTQGQIRGGVVAPARWRVARPERVLAVLGGSGPPDERGVGDAHGRSEGRPLMAAGPPWCRRHSRCSEAVTHVQADGVDEVGRIVTHLPRQSARPRVPIAPGQRPP